MNCSHKHVFVEFVPQISFLLDLYIAHVYKMADVIGKFLIFMDIFFKIICGF